MRIFNKVNRNKSSFHFKNYEHADLFLDVAHLILNREGVLTMADVKAILGIPTKKKDQKVGWKILPMDPSLKNKKKKTYKVDLGEPVAIG